MNGTGRALQGYGPGRLEPKPDPGYKPHVDPVHVNEDTGEPCRYCLVPASDPEKAFYQCVGVRKVERERRLAVRDYQAWAKTDTGKRIAAANRKQAMPDEVVQAPTPEMTDKEKVKHLALCDGYMCERAWCERGKRWRADRPDWRARWDEGATIVVQVGRPETAGRPEAGEQEQADRDGALFLSSLPQTSRKSVRAQGGNAGADTRKADADAEDEKVRRKTAARIAGVRARLRSSKEPGRPTDRTGDEVPGGSGLLSPLPTTDTARVGGDHAQAVAAPARKVKRGRPKKHVDNRARRRENSRAARERRRQRKP